MTSTERSLQGDTWDSVAKRCLGDEHLAPAVMAVNFAYREMTVFPEGITITLPEISGSQLKKELNLPPWKR